jgi:protein CrcB
MGYLLVFLGGGIGAALRHGANIAAARAFGTAFPYGTLAVNIIGSLAMGLLAAFFAFKGDATQNWRLFFTTGILGGFTTFSAFSTPPCSTSAANSALQLCTLSLRWGCRSPHFLPVWRWCGISPDRLQHRP